MGPSVDSLARPSDIGGLFLVERALHFDGEFILESG